MKKNSETIINRFKLIVNKSGFTWEQAGKALGFSRSTVRNVAYGTTSPSKTLYSKIEKVVHKAKITDFDRSRQ